MVKREKDQEGMIVTCINASLEKKAKDITVIELKGLSSFADYFLICSGTSNRQVQAISGAIQDKMKEAGYLPRGVEGEAAGTWILLDYYELVVHVFYAPVRVFYDLEGLWSEAPKAQIEEEAVSIGSLAGAIRY